MKYFIMTALILLLTSLSLISLFNGEYFSFFVQVSPSIISILKIYFPENPVIKILTSPISPHIYAGIKLSDYSAQMAFFGSKCFLVLIVIYSIPLSFNFDFDENSIYLAIYAFALPIFLVMSLVTAIFHTIKYTYVKVMKKDKVWVE
ncbi:hypothetical protein [Catenovulum maritimum]|uniref:Uncharacterized protein n=1 Tax=Catenovulum maritimum TaxID=1513271 RepID=A0A0J8JL09_9ALTE|nr:hypothetical protein [Catenovulum maritimum]KMT65236.1 hypothetical protein XM47_10125 [Catenovulum maritimum]